MKRWTFVLVSAVMMLGLSTGCTPTVVQPFANYTCNSGTSWDIGTTPIAGFAYGVKDNGLAFSSNNGTCTGPNPLKITLVESLATDPIVALNDAVTKCATLGSTGAVLLQGYPTLAPGIYECD